MKERRWKKPLFASAAIIGVLFTLLAFWPPWWGKAPFMLHYHYGFPHFYFGDTAHGRMLPANFTGTYNQYYSSGVLGRSEEFVDGELDGVRRDFDEKGNLTGEGIYRDGLPWSGWCTWWDGKPWAWAEYREGKVWTGVSVEWDEGKGESLRQYFYEGQEHTEIEYEKIMKEMRDRAAESENRTEQDDAGKPNPAAS